MRNTEPHQKYSSRIPPSTGPIAPPAEKLEIHTPMATARCFGSRNILKIKDRVDGARVAPAIPINARLKISIPGLVERSKQRNDSERGRTNQKQTATADSVP